MLLEAPIQLEESSFHGDPASRRDLVERIVSSSLFLKSQRLSEFLRYVCALAETGNFSDINEQSIGSAVFGRSRDYDPSIDSIVRSHASRLRHRLRDYFEQDGAGEALILTIPRGSYIPKFEWRSTDHLELHRKSVSALANESDGSSNSPFDLPSTSTAVASDEGEHLDLLVAQGEESSQRRTVVRLKIALAVTAMIAVFLCGVLLWKSMPFVHASERPRFDRQHPLWSQFAVPPGASTLVVSSDSGLVMLQHMTTRRVTLSSYVSGEYLKQVSSSTVPESIVRKFGTRRYTPAVDLFVLEKMMRLFGEDNDRPSFRYARDLRLSELKQGNAILLGTAESNPWVQLYEPSMNFYFEDDLANDRSQMMNRHPQPGESLHYDSRPDDPAPTIYGVVAYRPNLNGTGKVLILEGQTMAGTQTAIDFALDDSYLLPFLEKIRRSNGSIPYFEILLRSSSVGGQSSRLETVATRVSKD